MKAIINGKRYDTETATEIAKYWNGLSSSDFKHIRETLYRTPRGNWFIAGEGGPMSRYAESCGDGLCGGSAIRVLSSRDAELWLESHGEIEALETYFEDNLEDA